MQDSVTHSSLRPETVTLVLLELYKRSGIKERKSAYMMCGMVGPSEVENELRAADIAQLSIVHLFAMYVTEHYLESITSQYFNMTVTIQHSLARNQQLQLCCKSSGS